MFEALIVTLREGVEAALVIGIIVAFLRREGSSKHLSAVWSAVVAATLASLLGAYLLYRAAVNEEVFEGLLYVGSAVLVATMLVWMWRHSRAIAGEVKGALSRILERERGGSVWAGLFLFTFLMVFREGVETVLFLSALSLTTSGLLASLGALAGLGAAVVFGVLFVRGSVRIDLGRFFTITGVALLVFLVQLLLNGYHELSEAGWLPANETTMATVGPLVKNEFFFIAAVVLLPLLALALPGRPQAAGGPTAPPAGNPAAERLERASTRRQGRARVLATALGAAILTALGLGYVYARPPAALSPATPVAPGPGGDVRIPLSTFSDGALRRFSADLGGRPVRFFAVPIDDRDIATAFDACLICGPRGYYQEAGSVFCLHCASAIYPPSIGQPGGCNPIPLRSRLEGGELVISTADLEAGVPTFAGAAGEHAAHGI